MNLAKKTGKMKFFKLKIDFFVVVIQTKLTRNKIKKTFLFENFARVPPYETEIFTLKGLIHTNLPKMQIIEKRYSILLLYVMSNGLLPRSGTCSAPHICV